MEVTILNEGSVRGPGVARPPAAYSFSRGVRYFDTAAAYGTEAAFKKWFAAQPEVRKQIFLATKDGVGNPADMVKQIDKRLAALGTDYIDLLFFHGLGSTPGRLAQEQGDEGGRRGHQEDRQGQVRRLHDPRRRRSPEQLQNAAEGGFIDVIMLQFSPWLDRDAPLNRAIDACHKQNIGIVSMKQMAGQHRRSNKLPVLKERGLNSHQGLLTAIWSDERISATCVTMMNTDQVNQNTEAARKFEPLKQAEIHQLRDAVLAAGPMMCADCDGRCAHAAGTKARLGDLTRFLTYHEHHGSRRQAREGYAELCRGRARLARRRPRGRPRGLPQQARLRPALARGRSAAGLRPTKNPATAGHSRRDLRSWLHLTPKWAAGATAICPPGPIVQTVQLIREPIDAEERIDLAPARLGGKELEPGLRPACVRLVGIPEVMLEDLGDHGPPLGGDHPGQEGMSPAQRLAVPGSRSRGSGGGDVAAPRARERLAERGDHILQRHDIPAHAERLPVVVLADEDDDDGICADEAVALEARLDDRDGQRRRCRVAPPRETLPSFPGSTGQDACTLQS